MTTCCSARCVSDACQCFASVSQLSFCVFQEMDDDRYRRALHASALEQDIESFDDGDLTQIGDRGINLSGGQKARCVLLVVRVP